MGSGSLLFIYNLIVLTQTKTPKVQKTLEVQYKTKAILIQMNLWQQKPKLGIEILIGVEVYQANLYYGPALWRNVLPQLH